MNLEDLRYDSIGQIFCWCPQKGNDENSMVHLTFHEFTNKAFYLTCQCIEQLENSVSVINQGNLSLTTALLWFVSLESYINSLLKIICFKENIDLNHFKKKDFNYRLNNLLNYIDISKENTILFNQTGIRAKINEFQAFRNEIAHDTHFEKEVKFCKTVFSKHPFLCNQVDVMQALIICLEVFTVFHKVYKGCQLMPDIFVQKNDSFFYRKLDLLYDEIIKPYFQKTLEKHKLSTKLSLDYTKFYLPPSQKVNLGEIQIVIKALPHIEPFKPNETKTFIGKVLMDTLKGKAPEVDYSSNFTLPKY